MRNYKRPVNYEILESTGPQRSAKEWFLIQHDVHPWTKWLEDEFRKEHPEWFGTATIRRSIGLMEQTEQRSTVWVVIWSVAEDIYHSSPILFSDRNKLKKHGISEEKLRSSFKQWKQKQKYN